MPDDAPASTAVYQDEHIPSLCAADLGRWLVTTQGSTHVWDIQPDRVLYRRLPGEASRRFVADGVEVELTRIDRWPAVGATSLIWFNDPAFPELLEQWRKSSTVRSIVRLAADYVPAGEVAPIDEVAPAGTQHPEETR